MLNPTLFEFNLLCGMSFFQFKVEGMKDYLHIILTVMLLTFLTILFVEVLVALLCVNELDASNCSMQEILTRLSGCLQHQLPDSAFPTVQNSESVISNLCE